MKIQKKIGLVLIVFLAGLALYDYRLSGVILMTPSLLLGFFVLCGRSYHMFGNNNNERWSKQLWSDTLWWVFSGSTSVSIAAIGVFKICGLLTL
jgi:hypothetical protein